MLAGAPVLAQAQSASAPLVVTATVVSTCKVDVPRVGVALGPLNVASRRDVRAPRRTRARAASDRAAPQRSPRRGPDHRFLRETRASTASEPPERSEAAKRRASDGVGEFRLRQGYGGHRRGFSGGVPRGEAPRKTQNRILTGTLSVYGPASTSCLPKMRPNAGTITGVPFGGFASK